jgi:hypothetical protein
MLKQAKTFPAKREVRIVFPYATEKETTIAPQTFRITIDFSRSVSGGSMDQLVPVRPGCYQASKYDQDFSA